MKNFFLVLIVPLCATFAFPYQCPPCTIARFRCDRVVESATCEPIPEPNCGCCLMCARREGENCGTALGFCGSGLICTPRPLNQTNRKYFYEEMNVCMSETDYDNGNELENDENFGDYSYEEEEGRARMLSYQFLPNSNLSEDFVEPPLLTPLRGGHKSEIPEPLYPFRKSSCQKHWDRLMAKAYLSPHEWVPSCTEEGDYIPLQCELTHGLVRGRCWCVDSNGKAISGFVRQRSDCNRMNRIQKQR